MAPPRRRIRPSDEVVATLRTLHPEIKRKLRAALGGLLAGTVRGKPLREGLAGYSSLKIGRFRAIYREAPNGVVEFVMFGPRSSIYRETLRLLTAKEEKNS